MGNYSNFSISLKPAKRFSGGADQRVPLVLKERATVLVETISFVTGRPLDPALRS
jgi:hypothetical protein